MTLPANIRINVAVPFPAQVVGGGGIKVSKANGIWTIQPDFTALAVITPAGIVDPTTKEIWIFDPASGIYNVMTLADMGNALYTATSVTSLTIGAGSQTFAIQSGKDIGVGSFVLAVSNANPANYMLGQVTAYAGTALTMNVNASGVGGSGTHADWTLRASSPSGAQGQAGAGYTATSATSNTIANSGSVNFTTQAGLAYTPGARVRASDTANPTTNYMEGVVTAYGGTTLTFTADLSNGGGTLTSWNINLAGNKGTNGTGTGDFSSNTSVSVDGEIVLFSGTSGKLGKRSALTGLLKSASGVASAATAGTDYLAPPSGTAIQKAASGAALAAAVAGTDYVDKNTTSLLGAGYTATSFSVGTITSGTVTPAAASGNFQHMTANGAFTLAPPVATCTVELEVTNGASAGAITTSGFTFVNGDTYVTTSGNKFIFHVEKTQTYSRLNIEKLQ